MNNIELLKKVKDCISNVKVWKTEKQRDNLIKYLEPYKEQLNMLSLEERIDILHYSILLSKKSYMNILAKEFNLSLNDESQVKMWTVLENCNDNSYTLQILKNKDEWADFSNGQYFFEQVLLKGRSFYIYSQEKEWCKKLQDMVIKKTDVGFWLSKEKQTGLSKASYATIKYEQFGEFNRSIMDIKPGWLEQDYYNIVNINNHNVYLEKDRFQLEEKNIDWNKIIRNEESYPLEAKQAVRKILDHYWCQKTESGEFVFQSSKVKNYVLASVWLMNEKHIQMGILTKEEKEKLLEKFLNDNNAHNNIKSAEEEGKYTRMLLEHCCQEECFNWQNVILNENAWKALTIGQYDKLVKNLYLKSALENKLCLKNSNEKKIKI